MTGTLRGGGGSMKRALLLLFKVKICCLTRARHMGHETARKMHASVGIAEREL